MNPDVVHGNDWRSLDPAPIGGWTPTRRVTVVVPCYNGQEPLALTFAALGNQTYPRDLLEVVVADEALAVRGTYAVVTGAALRRHLITE